MTIPIHNLHVYQKPKLGTSFIRRLPVYNYRHSINAIGGFDSMSCDISLGSVDETQEFLNQFIGNMVRVYVDDPIDAAWEGFINRMTFNAGGTQYTISLDEMANRLSVKFIDPAVSATNPTASLVVNDTTSQGIYAIKQSTLDMGIQTSANTSYNALRDTALAQRAWPKTSRIPGQGQQGLLHIECLGFFHTLSWELYNDTSTAAQALNTYLTTLLAAVANGTTFFDNGDTSGIAANAITTRRESIRGETIWDRMLFVREIGDSTNYFVIGISPTDFQTGTRSLYYRAFNSAINYTARQSDGLIIRNLYGQKIDPWRVQPDNGVEINDMLIGWNGVGDNPTETWIMAIDYDANRQLATWRGDDDITSEGAFQFNRYIKGHGRRFGATKRFV